MPVIRVCESCGTKNRVPASHLADQGRCGSCKATLSPISEPISADHEIFDETIRSVKVPVLVDFWAAWCGPCRMAAPEVAKVAKNMAGRAVVMKVDTEKHPQLAARYKVSGIPNFVVFRDGNVVFQQAGAVGAAQMESWLTAEPVSR